MFICLLYISFHLVMLVGVSFNVSSQTCSWDGLTMRFHRCTVKQLCVGCEADSSRHHFMHICPTV